MLMVVENEVEYAYRIDRRELEVPFPPQRLLLDREASIENASVLEEVLFRLLDFNDEAFPILTLAIDVEDGFAVDWCVAQVLGAFVGQLLDSVAFGQQRVEEVNQELLIRLRSENALEAKIGQQIDVSLLQRVRHQFSHRRANNCLAID